MSTTETQSIPVPEPGLTQDEIVQRARDMIPVLRERQEECERIGRLPDETSRDFVEAGFYRILQPRRFGGYEFDLPTFTRVAIALARGCPASGWTYTLTAGHAHMLAALWSEEGQIDIYGADGEVRMPGPLSPGHGDGPVDGGYRVSGTWDYVSGCDSATHLAFGFMLGDDASAGEMATDFIGVVDYADCEIIDNWDVLGLRGTGSKRVVVEDVFVPERRTIDSIFRLDAPPAAGRTVHEAPIYREGGIGGLIFSETASVAIGTAWGVLDLYEESLRKRKTTVLPLIPMTEHAQYPRFFGEAFQSIDVAESRAAAERPRLHGLVAAGGRGRDRVRPRPRLAPAAAQAVLREARLRRREPHDAHQRLGRHARRRDVAAPAARPHGAHDAQHGPARAGGRQLRAPALRAAAARGRSGLGAGAADGALRLRLRRARGLPARLGGSRRGRAKAVTLP